VQIAMDGNIINISVKQTEEKEEKDRRFTRQERRLRAAERSITLPMAGQDSEINAKLEDGVLRVEVPKQPEKRLRRIEVH
jgi:HSP20 family protein